MWGRAPWKSSLGSSQHLEDEWCLQEIRLSLPAALPTYNESESVRPGDMLSGRTPSEMSHDDKNVVEPSSALYKINRN